MKLAGNDSKRLCARLRHSRTRRPKEHNQTTPAPPEALTSRQYQNVSRRTAAAAARPFVHSSSPSPFACSSVFVAPAYPSSHRASSSRLRLWLRLRLRFGAALGAVSDGSVTRTGERELRRRQIVRRPDGVEHAAPSHSTGRGAAAGNHHRHAHHKHRPPYRCPAARAENGYR